MPLVDGGVREGPWVPFAIPRKAVVGKRRPVVPQFATLVFRGLDVGTIWGVQLPSCLRRA